MNKSLKQKVLSLDIKASDRQNYSAQNAIKNGKGENQKAIALLERCGYKVYYLIVKDSV